MFAVHPFRFLSQSMRGHFCDVPACAMWDIVNCDRVGVVFLGDNVDYHSEYGIWNGNASNHVVILHESNALSFAFVIQWGCSWIAMHYPWEPWSWVGTIVQGKEKWDRRIGSVVIVENPRCGARASLCCNWNPASVNANTSSFERLIPIFNGYVLGTMGQSTTYFFLLPFT